MRFLSSLRIVRVTLALAVAFWMAGAGCMLGCGNMVMAAAANEAGTAAHSEAMIVGVKSRADSFTVVVAGDACPSMHAHDCCARHKAASKPHVRSAKSAVKSNTPAVQNSGFSSRTLLSLQPLISANSNVSEFGGTSSPMMDCPLAVNASAALSKARADDSSITVPLTSANAALPTQQEQASALSAPLRIPNRGHTYLRCCAFLI
jgi:hypothetical protein